MKKSENVFNVVLLDDDEEDALLVRDVIEDYARTSSMNIKFYSFQKPEPFQQFLQEIVETRRMVFLDIKMPEMDGFSVLKKIRQSMVGRRIPVVMYSSSDAQSDIQRAYDNAANGYIEKSYDIKYLSYSMSSAIEFFGVVNLQ